MISDASLKSTFSRQIIRWTAAGLLGSTALAAALVVFIGVKSSEDHLQATAFAAAKAFREDIISNRAAGETERQIRDSVHLSPDERVAIRDRNFQKIYAVSESSPEIVSTPSCRIPGQICWHVHEDLISVLVPVYFGEPGSEIAGYLDLSLSPHFDFNLLLAFFVVICVGAMIQAIGLSTRVMKLSGQVGDQLNIWADQIRENPKAALSDERKAPFDELRPMQEALTGLNSEIAKLEDRARDSAKLSVIRGIAHDILTPVSQIQKFVAVLKIHMKSSDPAVSDLLIRMQRSLGRLAAMAHQTKILRNLLEESEEMPPPPAVAINLGDELRGVIDDLQKDPEIESKKITLISQVSRPDITWPVHAEDFYRITSNLVKNAIHASPDQSSITIMLKQEGEWPILVIQDQGSGIPKEIQDRIFELDFTTRPGAGTGLGLMIVRQLCLRNRAEINFTSAPGLGTQFQVQFQS
jgi:signal transduction histidine kinase